MMLALQEQGPMFKSQNPCTHTCNPSTREWRQEDPYRLLVSQPRLLGEFQNNERFCLKKKKKVGSNQGTIERV